MPSLFYDAAVSGGDPIAERPGFKAMLDRIAGNGVRCIIVTARLTLIVHVCSGQVLVNHDQLRPHLMATVCEGFDRGLKETAFMSCCTTSKLCRW